MSDSNLWFSYILLTSLGACHETPATSGVDFGKAGDVPGNPAVGIDSGNTTTAKRENNTRSPDSILAEAWGIEYAHEYRDSGWATRTESLVNERVEKFGGTVRSPLVCKRTVCQGTFSFEDTDHQNRALMGIELTTQLGFPFASLVLPAPDKSDVVFLLRKSTTIPKARGDRPPPPTDTEQ